MTNRRDITVEREDALTTLEIHGFDVAKVREMSVLDLQLLALYVAQPWIALSAPPSRIRDLAVRQ